MLDMDVSEALEFFADHPRIRPILQTLVDVGLGYIKLGQSATTLSGGEAQRIKLAKELSRNRNGTPYTSWTSQPPACTLQTSRNC